MKLSLLVFSSTKMKLLVLDESRRSPIFPILKLSLKLTKIIDPCSVIIAYQSMVLALHCSPCLIYIGCNLQLLINIYQYIKITLM